MFGRLEAALLAGVVAMLAGLGTGYVLWGWPTNWYAQRDAGMLPATPENELIRYGWQLVIDTPRFIGKNARDPGKRFAGNDLACSQCHINGGLRAFAAPFVSTFASFPILADDRVLTLAERINGCMTRSMNGRPLPENSREMEGFIAYLRYIGTGAPEGVRVAGMGLKALHPAARTPDRERGAQVYANTCASCHGANGEGQPKLPPDVGFSIPPLWGGESFNAAAGMSRLETAAAFIRANMPYNINYNEPVLTEQQAWDVAAFMISQPRPPVPANSPR